MDNLVCQVASKGLHRRVSLDEGLQMKMDEFDGSVIVKFYASPVALVRYGHFKEDTYRFVTLKDLITEEISGGEPLEVYTKGTIPVCGRSIDTYKRQFLDQEGMPLHERLEKNQDKLYIEIGPGFSELIVREAHKRKENGGIAPLAIDPFDYAGAMDLLSACNAAYLGIEIYSDASNPLVTLSAHEVKRRMEVFTDPSLVTLVPRFFSKKENLPKGTQQHIDRLGGAHTLVDFCAAGMYVPLEKSTNPEKEMRRLLGANGRMYTG
jgi:hypothetical protein